MHADDLICLIVQDAIHISNHFCIFHLHGVRVGLYVEPTVLQLIKDADDRFFNSIYNKQHVLHRLLPERHNANYNL